MADDHDISSLRCRRKTSPLKISCFHNLRSDFHHHYSSTPASPTLKLSPSSWLKSKLKSHMHSASSSSNRQLIKSDSGGDHRRHQSTCGCIMSRMSRHRRHSAEFNYDPLSYSLNFDEDESCAQEVDENFMSRLPVSPVRAKKLDHFPARMEAVQMRKGDDRSIAIDENTGELENQFFEVRMPRVLITQP